MQLNLESSLLRGQTYYKIRATREVKCVPQEKCFTLADDDEDRYFRMLYFAQALQLAGANWGEELWPQISKTN
jgi:hypothetical protein